MLRFITVAALVALLAFALAGCSGGGSAPLPPPPPPVTVTKTFNVTMVLGAGVPDPLPGATGTLMGTITERAFRGTIGSFAISAPSRTDFPITRQVVVTARQDLAVVTISVTCPVGGAGGRLMGTVDVDLSASDEVISRTIVLSYSPPIIIP